MEDNNRFQINFLEFFYHFFSAIRRSIIPLAVLNGLILAGGVTYRLTTDLAYEGSILVKSNFVEFNYIEEILAPINRHIKDRKPEGIARTLDLPMEVAVKCGRVSLSSVIDEEYVTKRRFVSEEALGEYEKDVVFVLTVAGADHEILPVYKEAILDFLKSQNYIQSRKEFFNRERRLLTARLEADMQAMDSIKRNYAKIDLTKKTGVNGVLLQDLGDFFYGGSMVYEKYLEFKYDLNFSDSFEELSQFEYFDKYASPRWTQVLIYTAIAGLILSLLFLFIVELKRFGAG